MNFLGAKNKPLNVFNLSEYSLNGSIDGDKAPNANKSDGGIDAISSDGLKPPGFAEDTVSNKKVAEIVTNVGDIESMGQTGGQGPDGPQGPQSSLVATGSSGDSRSAFIVECLGGTAGLGAKNNYYFVNIYPSDGEFEKGN